MCGGEQDLEAEHDTNLHYFTNTITSLQENTMQLQKDELCPQAD